MNRLQLIKSQLDAAKLSKKESGKDTITISDNRSGKHLNF
jgi:hypothetical protein